MHVDGACHCGAISFDAEIDPADVLVCHCTDCQVLSGTPPRAVVTLPVERFRLSGTPARDVEQADSGNRRAQMFCPHCGSHLFAAAAEGPTGVSVRLGCVTQRAQLRPRAQIRQHSAMPWLADLSSVPASAEQQALVVARAGDVPAA